MAKRKTKLAIRIPPYEPPRNTWRQKIHRIVSLEAERAEVSYRPLDKLELKVRLYLKEGPLFSHDLDNRLKDIMDALQGRAGGSKKVQTLSAIIPNDRQVFRIVIEKSLPPKQSKGFGHLLVSKYGGK
ncbi:MAG: RusA family crossover junction endodeoxyribonuclease [Desulfobacterales bacterium]|nr:RusA family crossover junction endodeoxyribonuclease [Desulfobacterales bacterium]